MSILRKIQKPDTLKANKSLNITNLKFCQPKQYSEYLEKFVLFEEWFYFDYQAEFNELITIASIVELKYRIAHNACRFSKQKNAVEVINIGKLKFLQCLQSNTPNDQNEKAFKFRFCELVFTHLGTALVTKALSIKSQISLKLSKIASTPSILEQSREFLNIKYDYFVSLSTLKQEYNRIEQGKVSQKSQNTNNQLVEQFDLFQIQWRYLTTGKLPQKFLQLNLASFTEYCAFQRLIMKTICEKALKRVELLQNVARIQLQLEQNYGRAPISIMRYNFSYNELISKKQTAYKIQPLAEDLLSQIIIVYAGNKILSISTAREEFDFYIYANFLRKLFKRLNLQHFALVLYELNSKRKIIWQVYMHLCHYFKQMFDSHVYVSTNQAYFKRHLELSMFINNCLMANGVSAENFHQIFQKIVNRIADVFDRHGKKLQLSKKKQQNKANN